MATITPLTTPPVTAPMKSVPLQIQSTKSLITPTTGGTTPVIPAVNQTPNANFSNVNGASTLVPTPTITPAKPLPVSTTTVSNANKMQQVPQLQQQLAQVSDKGVRTDTTNGVTTTANGTVVESPDVIQARKDAQANIDKVKADADALYQKQKYAQDNNLILNADGTFSVKNSDGTPKTNTPGLVQKTNPDGTTALVTADVAKEEADQDAILKQMKESLDAGTNSLIDSIHQKFNQLRVEQNDINTRQLKGVTNALLKGGVTGQGSSAQYAPISSEGITAAQATYGLKQIAALDQQENEAILAAQQAQRDGDYKILGLKLAEVEQKRKEKIEAATELNKTIAAQNLKLQEKNLQATRDNAIANAYSSGITDPAAILKQLNSAGGNYSLKEIKDSIENIANTNGIDVKNLDKNTQLFYKLKAQKDGLPTSILHLPTETEQLAAFVRLMTNAETKKTGGGTGTGGGNGGGGTYANDLDALIGNAVNTISTKFGQETFKNSISKARNDADKLSTIATVVLKNSPAPIREDFVNQTVGIAQIDKAIKMLNTGTESGVLNSGAQYTFNVFGKDFDPKLAQLNQLIVSAIQPYRNSVTGAAWGTQEEAEYQALFGSTKYSPAELKKRLEGVKQIMKDKTTTALNAQVNPLGGSNQFDSTSSVGGSSADDFLNNPLPGSSGGAGGGYNPNVWN